jgi:hypothetical protein
MRVESLKHCYRCGAKLELAQKSNTVNTRNVWRCTNRAKCGRMFVRLVTLAELGGPMNPRMWWA